MRPEARDTRTQLQSTKHNSEGRMDPSQEPYDGLRAIEPHKKSGFPIISASTSAALSAQQPLRRSLRASVAARVLPRGPPSPRQ